MTGTVNWRALGLAAALVALVLVLAFSGVIPDSQSGPKRDGDRIAHDFIACVKAGGTLETCR